jgi:hypothetical protein
MLPFPLGWLGSIGLLSCADSARWGYKIYAMPPPPSASNSLEEIATEIGMGGSAAGRSGGSLLGRHRGVVKLHRYTRSAPAKYQGLRVGCSFGILRRCQFSAVRCGEDICVPGISVSNPSMTPYCHSLRISVSRSEFEHRDWGLGDLGHGAAVLWVLSPW